MGRARRAGDLGGGPGDGPAEVLGGGPGKAFGDAPGAERSAGAAQGALGTAPGQDRAGPRAVLGVDGCPGGWVGALVHLPDGPGGRPARPARPERPASAPGVRGIRVEWLWLPALPAVNAVDATVVGVDVPMGLTPDGTPRECDRAARRLLGWPRSASVFPAPPRPVLGAASYAEACARARGAGGRALSRQAFGILPRVAEADAVWGPVDPRAVHRRILEVHPEVSFRLLAGRDLGSKHTRAGLDARSDVLDAWLPAGVLGDLLPRTPGRVRTQDALDALACAWSATRWLRGDARVLPDGDTPVDERGLPMRIVA